MTIEYNSEEIEDAINEAIDDIIRQDGLAILTNLVLATPVGNPSLWQNPVAPPGYVGGHARRNWNVTINRLNDAEIPGVDESGAGTISQGNAAIITYRGSERAVFLAIQNGAPYTGRLNEGHSTQAPAFFVENAISAAIAQPLTRRNI